MLIRAIGGLAVFALAGSCGCPRPPESAGDEAWQAFERKLAARLDVPEALITIPHYAWTAEHPSRPAARRSSEAFFVGSLDECIAEMGAWGGARAPEGISREVESKIRHLFGGHSLLLRLRAAELLVLLGHRDAALRGQLEAIIREDQQDAGRNDSRKLLLSWCTVQAQRIGEMAGWEFAHNFSPALTITIDGDDPSPDGALLRRYGNSRFGTGAFDWIDASGEFFVTGRGTDVLVWDTLSGARLGRFDRPGRLVPAYPGHAVAYGSGAGDLQLIALPSGTELARLQYLDLERVDSDDDPPDRQLVGEAVAISASADGGVMLAQAGSSGWLVSNGFSQIQRLSLGEDRLRPRFIVGGRIADGGEIACVVSSSIPFPSDVSKVPLDTRVDVIDTANGAIVKQLTLADQFLPSGRRWAITANTEWLAFAHKEGQLRIFSLPALDEKPPLELQHCFSVTSAPGAPGQRSHVLIQCSGGELRLVDLSTREIGSPVIPERGYVAGETDLRTHLRNGIWMRPVEGRFHFHSGEHERSTWGELPAHFLGITTVAGRPALCARFGDREVRCIDTASGRTVATRISEPPLPGTAAGCTARDVPLVALRTSGGTEFWNPDTASLTHQPVVVLACSDGGGSVVTTEGICKLQEGLALTHRFPSKFKEWLRYPRWIFYNDDQVLIDRSFSLVAPMIYHADAKTPYLLLTEDPNLVPASEKDRRRVLDFTKGQLFARSAGDWQRHRIHCDAKHISIDPTFRYIAYSVSSDIYIHSMQLGQAIARIDAHVGYSAYAHSGQLALLEFLPGGELVSAGRDGQAFLWDFEEIVRRALGRRSNAADPS